MPSVVSVVFFLEEHVAIGINYKFALNTQLVTLTLIIPIYRHSKLKRQQ